MFSENTEVSPFKTNTDRIGKQDRQYADLLDAFLN